MAQEADIKRLVQSIAYEFSPYFIWQYEPKSKFDTTRHQQSNVLKIIVRVGQQCHNSWYFRFFAIVNALKSASMQCP